MTQVFPKSWIFGGLTVLAVAFGFYQFNSETEPVEVVRRQIIHMMAAAEERHLEKFMEYISPRFTSPEARDVTALRQLLARQFIQTSWVRAFPAELAVNERTSEVIEISGKFVFARSDAQELRQLARESVVNCFQIEALAEQEPDGEWRFVSASLEEIDPKLLLNSRL